MKPHGDENETHKRLDGTLVDDKPHIFAVNCKSEEIVFILSSDFLKTTLGECFCSNMDDCRLLRDFEVHCIRTLVGTCGEGGSATLGMVNKKRSTIVKCLEFVQIVQNCYNEITTLTV